MLITSQMEKKNIDVASDKFHSMAQLPGLYYARCHRQLLNVHTFAPTLTWILHNMSVSKTSSDEVPLASYRPKKQTIMNKKAVSGQIRPENTSNQT